MDNKCSILIVDDEAPIRKLLEITLSGNDYHVQLASTAREGMTQAVVHPPNLIILDLGLPDEDGQQVLLRLREWYLGPIIILSVRSAEEDIIRALDNGANDYLTKPFRTGELLARVRTAIRQVQVHQQVQILRFGELVIDLTARTVTLSDNLLKLTSTEYALLTLMAKNDGMVLTHQYILKNIWGPTYSQEAQYLRVFIGQLRKKIEPDPNNFRFILTESGVGYRFCMKDND